MSFQELTESIRMWLEGVIFISAESNSEDTILAHHELAVGKFFLESLEIVGGHVFPCEDVEELVLGHVGMDPFDNELLVLTLLGFGLGQ